MVLAADRIRKIIFATTAIVSMITAQDSMAHTKPVLEKIEFDQIDGWVDFDKTKSLAAFNTSCTQMTKDNRAFSKHPAFGGTILDWQAVCEQSKLLGKNPEPANITDFFQDYFTPLRVNDPDRKEGLFTGYFEPVVRGSLVRSSQFQVPVYRRPTNLVVFTKEQEKTTGLRYGRMDNGKPAAYFSRKKIEQGLLKGQGLELVWLKNLADAFFMQVQGSGRVELPDGSTMRLAYAGKTGLPYTAIGGVLVNDGELEKASLSMQTIRQWITDNPSKAQELMWKNKSFVFFRQLPTTDPKLGPVGAQHVNLTPEISFAVDRRYWSFGLPVWLDAKISLNAKDVPQTWRSLLVAQDTGSAIRGYARGDVFWGSGDKAAIIAGQMKAAGTMVVLLPNALANKLAK